MATEFDVIVIGAGTGGYVAAIRAAQLGLTVAVVERQKALGGTCLIWGCIPTKALLEHAHALKLARAAKEWGLAGIDGASVSIEMSAVHTRKDKIVNGLTGGVELLFKKNKIEWVKGSARLTGRTGVEVTLTDGTMRALAAKKELILATGSSARSVPGSRRTASASSSATKPFTCRRCPSRLRSWAAAPSGSSSRRSSRVLAAR